LSAGKTNIGLFFNRAAEKTVFPRISKEELGLPITHAAHTLADKLLRKAQPSINYPAIIATVLAIAIKGMINNDFLSL
jgi:hypothetical protein